MGGFAATGLAAAGEVLRSGVAAGLWPGVVAAAGHGATLQEQWVLGWAENWPGGRRRVAADTVFDLASLTKVLATTPAVLLLVRRGQLAYDDPVADYVPGVDARVRIRHLLTHTSGLPASVDLTGAAGLAAFVSAAATQELEHAPGAAVIYSDLGFILLGAVVTAVSGSPLGEFVDREVFGPVGSRLTYAPPVELLAGIAATEIVDGRPVHGRVHDENAAAVGEPVGHAGLFGALADVRACLPIWQPGGPVLDDAIRAEAMRDHTDGTGGHRGLGWTCRGDGHDILSAGWGSIAVSHTGFTGTSIALDPASGRWAVLLSNAVHYGRGRPEVLAARRRFHAALARD